MGMKRRVFLTAEWKHLAIFNWEIDPAVLEPYVPDGLDLDFWNGKCFISMVGFQFRRSALLGVPVLFHRSFPEVNLRFYVKRRTRGGHRRGVVFLSEIAPCRCVSYVARRFFGEKYRALPMRSRIARHPHSGHARAIAFEWRMDRSIFTLEVASEASPSPPDHHSLEEFIVEHYYAYSSGRRRVGGCMEYAVKHRPWMIQPATHATFRGDAAQLYGLEFAEVLSQPCTSAFLADGSAVSVYTGEFRPAARIAPAENMALAANDN
jgi:uncharacterized protein YqjF (DUF2071 family)